MPATLSACTPADRAPDVTPDNTLIAVFSYNMASELQVCLRSIIELAASFDVALIDDGSDRPETRAIIAAHEGMFTEVFHEPRVDERRSRGGLHRNIAKMFERAKAAGYRYLFMVQDDMQFVRPLERGVGHEYGRLFRGDAAVIQVDPRFLRRMGTIEVLGQQRAYKFLDSDYRLGYADVGILSIDRLASLGWTFEPDEKSNKVKAHRMGLKRLFPFTPIMAHLPYPGIYRSGLRKRRRRIVPLRRGTYRYAYMSPAEIMRMDSRAPDVVPYVKTFLQPEGMSLLVRLHYELDSEQRIFS